MSSLTKLCTSTKLFVEREILEEHEAESMLQWPHSGFHVHDEVLVPGDDDAFLLRLARYCARWRNFRSSNTRSVSATNG